MYILCIYGTWHGKLNFSADNCENNPHIAAQQSAQSADSARTFRGFHTGNQRILCGTISRFRAEFCECKTKITQSIDIRTILATCFSILQPVVVHEVRLLVSAIFNPNPHGRSAPTRTENSCPPSLNPHPPAWKFRGTRAENPPRSSQLSTGVCAEQQWNSLENVFRVMYPFEYSTSHL